MDAVFVIYAGVLPDGPPGTGDAPAREVTIHKILPGGFDRRFRARWSPGGIRKGRQ